MEKPTENKSFVPRGFFFFLILSKPFHEICFPSEIRVVVFIPRSPISISVFSAFQTVLLLCFLLSCASRGASLEQTGRYWSPFTAESEKFTKNHNASCGFGEIGCFFRWRGCWRARLCVFSSVSTLISGSFAQLRWPNSSRRVPGGGAPFPPPSSWHVRADTSWTPAASLCCFSARSPGSRQASVFKHHLPRSSVFSHPRPSLHHFTSPSSQIHFIDSEGHPIVSSR